MCNLCSRREGRRGRRGRSRKGSLNLLSHGSLGESKGGGWVNEVRMNQASPDSPLLLSFLIVTMSQRLVGLGVLYNGLQTSDLVNQRTESVLRVPISELSLEFEMSH